MTATTEIDPKAEHAHAEGHHEHPAWLAHHFDDAEQQYDSGKLGMWLFLVTEVLFFSGMFVAYALFRNRDPAVFEFCSQFLNEKLGAINTGVLLFSSLTMAWAVRAAQLRQHQLLTVMLAATLGCAAVFLGVKAVEYSHKWEIGLLPGRFFVSQLDHAGDHPHVGYLGYLMIVPAILTVCCAAYYVYAWISRSTFHLRVAGPMVVAGLCFFGGVGLGRYLEGEEEKAKSAARAAHHDEEKAHQFDHLGVGHGESEHHVTSLVPVTGAADVLVSPERLATPNADVNQKGMAGLFFSIYYCMTGIHAIHIIGGMLVITWLITKAARFEFHEKYFGPVDNVGLYWHLVDFIWIFLFPLLYLIT
jgi:cytochrome c oxidase subunit 3